MPKLLGRLKLFMPVNAFDPLAANYYWKTTRLCGILCHLNFMDVKLPKLGEGADSGVVVGIFVKEGDTVAKDQAILELETRRRSPRSLPPPPVSWRKSTSKPVTGSALARNC